MGYSVSVRFTNKEEQQRMSEFLFENMAIIESLKKTERGLPHNHIPTEGENLGYAPKVKHLLGFSGTGIPYYIWNLCAWMAMKSSTRSKSGEAYFYYDSEKTYLTEDINDRQRTVVDKEGLPVYQEKEDEVSWFVRWLIPENGEKEQHTLMQQLNQNWYEYLKNHPEQKSKLNKP
jgi:hypothetical protein